MVYVKGQMLVSITKTFNNINSTTVQTLNHFTQKVFLKDIVNGNVCSIIHVMEAATKMANYLP
jgi:hypothetical protein